MLTNDHFLIHQSCRDLVVRAAACADASDATGLCLLFAQDAILVRPNKPPLCGREAIRQAYEGRAPERITRHLVTNTIVNVDSPTKAIARSHVLLWTGSASTEDSPQGRRADARQVLGEFDDRFVLSSSGEWLIQERHARFVLYSE